jgi:hypothetical protein
MQIAKRSMETAKLKTLIEHFPRRSDFMLHFAFAYLVSVHSVASVAQ